MRKTAVVWLTVLCAGGASANPEQTLRNFVAAFTAGEMTKAVAHVKGGSVRPELASMVSSFKSMKFVTTIDSAKLVTKGNAASGPVKTTTRFNRQTKTDTETVRLVLENGKWLLIPPPAGDLEARKGNVNSMVVMCTEGMRQVFADAKERAKASASLSNIKQLAIATLIFTADHDDVVATTPSGWHKAIFPYCKNENIFHSPLDKGRGDSYSLNSRMAKFSLTKVKEPARTVLLYEGKSGKLEFRNQGRAAVAFCDGSARLITPEAAKSLRWTPS